MNRDERLALADRYEAGLRKMEAAGYEEFTETIREHKLVIAALRHDLVERLEHCPPFSANDCRQAAKGGWDRGEHEGCGKDSARAFSAARGVSSPPKSARWRHVKRGTTYTEICRAELQANRDVIEGFTLVIYRGDDGKYWARWEEEFEDGRFALISREESHG